MRFKWYKAHTRHTKSHNFNVLCLVVRLSLPNPLKPIKTIMKLEQHRQSMLQLHLCDHQVYWISCVPYIRGITALFRLMINAVSTVSIVISFAKMRLIRHSNRVCHCSSWDIICLAGYARTWWRWSHFTNISHHVWLSQPTLSCNHPCFPLPI